MVQRVTHCPCSSSGRLFLKRLAYCSQQLSTFSNERWRCVPIQRCDALSDSANVNVSTSGVIPCIECGRPHLNGRAAHFHDAKDFWRGGRTVHIGSGIADRFVVKIPASLHLRRGRRRTVLHGLYYSCQSLSRLKSLYGKQK